MAISEVERARILKLRDQLQREHGRTLTWAHEQIQAFLKACPPHTWPTYERLNEYVAEQSYEGYAKWEEHRANLRANAKKRRGERRQQLTGKDVILLQYVRDQQSKRPAPSRRRIAQTWLRKCGLLDLGSAKDEKKAIEAMSNKILRLLRRVGTRPSKS